MFRHAQGHPDSSSLHPNTPGMSRPPTKTAKSREKLPKAAKTAKSSTEPECQVRRESTLDHLVDHQLTTTVSSLSDQNQSGGSTNTASDGKEGINIGSPTDHQLTHCTQTSRNWNTVVQAIQAVQEHHVMHRKTGKLLRY